MSDNFAAEEDWIMLKTIGVGTEVFHKMIEENKYYVDKTALLRTVFKENGSEVLLITRPRRFGKTLTMSTFHDFLALDPSNPGDTSRQENWFRNTEIFADREFCNEFMGRFPVIFLTLKSVAFDNFNDSYCELARVINSMALNFSYLKSSSELDNDELKILYKLLDLDFLKDPANKYLLTGSLVTLTNLLYRHHKISPVLLIDEYDVPVAKAAHFGYYREMINVVGQLLANGLKGNTNMKKAVLTGCLRAAKESIFTGLNNFQNCTILNSGNDRLSAGFGFTEEETNAMLSYYGLQDYAKEVKNNYDGYNFGDLHMYCPWDVVSFCAENHEKIRKPDSNIIADNYWINTSGNDVIEEFMGFIEPEDVDLMQDLLDGKSITAEVRTALCYGDLQNHDINDFWTLLLYTGYLTFEPQSHNPESDEYNLYIPNEEIRKCFKSRILNFFKKDPVMKNHTKGLMTSLFSGEADKVQEHLNGLLKKYVSIRDFATKAPKENYYHGFMNGLLINSVSYARELKSNIESGNGYIDLIIGSEEKHTLVILELKQTDTEPAFGGNTKSAHSALKQIIDTGYAEPYADDDFVKNIYAYGICFHRKSCAVAGRKLK